MASAKKRRNIVVLIAKNFKKINISLPKLKKLVKFICNRFKLSKATVSIAIVDDAQIRKVNKQFLNKNRPTDCISFDLSENKKNAVKSFELVVNGEMAVRYAKLQGHSAEAELALYITHGLLHNLGFDDSTKKQAEKMHNAEDQILRLTGFGPVYNSAKK
ncbi:MAG: rRNA maturation RNase YbeY [Phycisphaerae bacterium]|nr:rRNA maturation RNase YbeY [Phycisphaerae bacterium]MDD5380607.1 rRNA maturation RNase YbeY [Phycisphaerae bacterium]